VKPTQKFGDPSPNRPLPGQQSEEQYRDDVSNFSSLQILDFKALPVFVWVIWCQIVPQIVCEKEVPRFLPFVRGGLRWGRVLDLYAS
jgi:hypothetical protein